MKKLLVLTVLIVGVLTGANGFADNLVFQWNAVDWAVGGKVTPDPAKQFYNLYQYDIDGSNETKLNDDPIIGTATTYSVPAVLPLRAGYKLTAVNAFGESEKSVAVYAMTPEAPSGLKLFLQKLVSFLNHYISRMS